MPCAGRTLVEPFVGGLAVVLGLRPQRAILADVNPHLINFYRWLQHGLDTDGVIFRNDREVFYANRERFNVLIRSAQQDTAEAAALFYYLNRTAFNGLCRFNAGGEFNVPFGRHKTIPYLHDFTPYRDALHGYEFLCSDFSHLGIESNSVVYADPPYDVEFTSYTAGGFCWDDQVRLAGWLGAREGPVIASNQATERVLDLYREQGFSVRTLPAPRRISCNGNRDDAGEMLAMKNV